MVGSEGGNKAGGSQARHIARHPAQYVVAQRATFARGSSYRVGRVISVMRT